ncbi:MAG TPA: hypothetical protein VMF55_03455 [Solirubrobacterales bacterium]|nr:hypothetical protein [Solirubrobacterales bacterium]
MAALCAALVPSIAVTGAAGKPGKCVKGAEAPGCTLPVEARFYKQLKGSSAITVQVGDNGLGLTLYGVPIKCTKFAPMLGSTAYLEIGLGDRRHPKVGKSYTLKKSESRKGEDGQVESANTEVTLTFKSARLVVLDIHHLSETGAEVDCDGGATYDVKRQS